MNAIRRIRSQLGLSQACLGGCIGVSQGSVSFYEKGQAVPPHVAKRLIDVCSERGVAITYDDVYSASASASEAAIKSPERRDGAVT